MTRESLVPLGEAAPGTFRDARLVLTDMDDTLTDDGRLSASTYEAIERLTAAGVAVIPVTAAPAGWCDQMALMWPITAVIGENGGFSYQREGRDVRRRYWISEARLEEQHRELGRISQELISVHRDWQLADDQPFRRTSIAFKKPSESHAALSLSSALAELGLNVTVNSIWVLGWLGRYDKLLAAERFLPELIGLDVTRDETGIVYVGDSANDAPMFRRFSNSVGVSTVRQHLSDIPVAPRWITRGAGGSGFEEVAAAILSERSRS